MGSMKNASKCSFHEIIQCIRYPFTQPLTTFCYYILFQNVPHTEGPWLASRHLDFNPIDVWRDLRIAGHQRSPSNLEGERWCKEKWTKLCRDTVVVPSFWHYIIMRLLPKVHQLSIEQRLWVLTYMVIFFSPPLVGCCVWINKKHTVLPF